MNGNSNISKEWSAHATGRHPAWNPLRHRLALCIALVLALAIGSAGQTAPARAQGTIREYYYSVDVSDPPRQICVGEERAFNVRIRVTLVPGSNQPNQPAEMPLPPGTTITAHQENGDIVDITSASAILVSSPNASSYRPGIVVFTVKGKKGGGTTITFSAVMPRFKAQPVQLPVKVANCPVNVLAISRFSAKYPGYTIKFLAVTRLAKVTTNENPNQYLGEATVYWIATSVVPYCAPSDTLSPGKVTISGTADEKTGALHLNLVYDPVPFTEVIPCVVGSGGSTGIISVTPLEVTVPRSGGFSPASQALTYKSNKGDASIPAGSAFVYIIP
jgi:hypothetical protein